jgi:phosphatidylglycerol lysyltransferase
MTIKTITSRINYKVIIQIAAALVPITFCIYFVKHEGYELNQSLFLIKKAQPWWLLVGFLVTVAYLIVHGNMYVSSFRAMQAKVSFSSAFILALKRSFISVFLPAGGVSSLAFFTSIIEKQGVTKTKIHLASTIYGIAAFGSLIIVAIPAVLLLFLSNDLSSNILWAFMVLIFAVIFLILALRSLLKNGLVFNLLKKISPKIIVIFKELKGQEYSSRAIFMTVFWSLLIELCGVIHLFVAMKALGFDGSIKIALIGYVVATMFLAISPFMRGLGAVEISLTLILVSFGIPQIQAISITFLYRFFEFWLPLFTGALSFFFKKDNLVLRVFPSFLILLLGLVNIFSVLTPAIGERLEFLKDFISEGAIYFSNFMVIVSGVILIVLSAYLIRGIKNAWILAIIVSILSVIGHLTKAIDFEEALLGLFVVITLIYTRKYYRIKSNRNLFHNAKYYILAGFCFIWTYGIIGFYIADQMHFLKDFHLYETFFYVLSTAFLFSNNVVSIQTEFAQYFIHSLNFLGSVFYLFAIYFILKPAIFRAIPHDNEKLMASGIISKYGRTALDYFKSYKDKNFFFSKIHEALVSFRYFGDYAVVLETPVNDEESKIPDIVSEFDEFAAANGLKTMYYRVDEKHLPLFESLKKKSIFIGQEGLIDIQNFTLKGGEMKSTRNSIHKVESNGFDCKIIEPPQKEGLIQKLKAVSDEWLSNEGKKESAFSQGIWDAKEIKNQTLFVIEDQEEKVVAFANIIPDYAPDEITYDLIRKTNDAPSGVLDVLMVKMIEHYKEQGKKYLNLGLAPFSGIEKSGGFKEWTIKFAYENLKPMEHYKGLRFFKEKYATIWQNKYLIYSNDYDLLQAPMIVSKVSRYKDKKR